MKSNFDLNLQSFKSLGDYTRDLNKYADVVNALPPQIKIIILIVVMGILFNIWSVMLWSPLQKNKEEVTSKTIALTEEVLAVRHSIGVLQKELSAKMVAAAQSAEKNKLQQPAVGAEAVAADSNVAFLALVETQPSQQQIADVLSRVFPLKNNLRLISLQTIAVKESADPVTKQKCLEHTFAIKFRGDYFSTLAYMKDIAKLNWSIYWDSLNYAVTKYPEAEITLQIRAFSSQVLHAPKEDI